MKNYYSENIEDLFKHFSTSRQGLSAKEAAKRLDKYGQNVLPKKKKDSILKIFLLEFWDPLVLMLVVAIIASLIAGEIVDAIVIFGIILVDAIMGTYQENKANRTAESLANLVRVNINVMRDGRAMPLDAELLVPGDIVLLESGNKIPADIRLIEVHNFTVDESILTGESVQVAKSEHVIEEEKTSLSDRLNIAYSGTTAISGRAVGLVVGTGLETELGKIADKINQTDDEKTPLMIRIAKLTRQITLMVIAVAIITAALLAIKRTELSELLITVIAFAVSAMPEGLPLALTMALTIASNRMARRNVIVRQLKAAESLGSCTVIASDKTGTLTVNQQTAKKIVLPNNEEYQISGTGYDTHGSVEGNIMEYAEEIALMGAINNEAREDKKGFFGDSIDIAFLVLAKKLKTDTSQLRLLETIPYESENKYSAVFFEQDGKTYCTVKGSLETVFAFCDKVNFSKTKSLAKLEEQNEQLASNGYRVIAVAKGEVKKQDGYSEKDIKGLTFLGLVAFIDPVREEAKKSIAQCRKAGIKVLMVTGDHPLTALSIAKDLKIAETAEQVANGDDVQKSYGQGERDFDEFIASKTVFARVTPLQKLYIVESLKRQGEFVAVTGDGVNDAPALKSANIGVAMGSGTDIAHETADMIIIDDNFTSIVSGVEEGRIAYANIRKILFFLLSCGFSEAIFFCLAVFLGMPAPLTAVQFLWLNIVTDGLQDIALSFERGESDVLNKPPRNPKESIFDKILFARILSSGIAMSLIAFVAWSVMLNVFHFELATARGYVMCLVVFLQNLHVLNCRSEQHSLFSVSIFKNPIVILTIIGNIVLQMIVMEFAPLSDLLDAVTIPFAHLGILFAISLVILPIVELFKFIFAQISSKKKTPAGVVRD